MCDDRDGLLEIALCQNIVTIVTDRHAQLRGPQKDIIFLGRGGVATRAREWSRLTALSEYSERRRRRGAGSPFQRDALASQRAQNLLAGRIFDSPAVKSAFALLLARVTEPE